MCILAILLVNIIKITSLLFSYTIYTPHISKYYSRRGQYKGIVPSFSYVPVLKLCVTLSKSWSTVTSVDLFCVCLSIESPIKFQILNFIYFSRIEIYSQWIWTSSVISDKQFEMVFHWKYLQLSIGVRNVETGKVLHHEYAMWGGILMHVNNELRWQTDFMVHTALMVRFILVMLTYKINVYLY